MNRDIGREGQDVFSSWCNNIGLTANRSDAADKHGWDYLVEFPTPKPGKVALDQQPSPIECKIQVKSTLQKEKKFQVKLSVMHRLVMAQMPTFFVFIEFGDSNLPEAAYLVHLDSVLIAETLKRVRQLEAQDELGRLNKATMTIKYSDKDKLMPEYGPSLKSAIEACVPKGMNEYVSTKNKQLKELGFEVNPYHIKVTFEDDGNVLNDLVDMSLGLKDSMTATNMEAWIERFGIQLPDKQITLGGELKISMPDIKPSKKGILYFKEDKYTAPVEFLADIYFPAMARELPKEAFKALIKTGFMDIEMGNNNKKFTFHLKNIEQKNLAELRKILWLIMKLRGGGKLLYGLTLQDDSHTKIEYEAKPGSNDGLPDVSNILSAAESAIYICHEFHVPTESINVTIELLDYFSESIHQFCALLRENPNLFHVSGTLVKNNDAAKLTPSVAYVDSLKTRIGDICFMLIYAIYVDKVPDIDKNPQFTATAYKKDIMRKWCGAVSEITSIDLNKELDTCMTDIGNQVDVVLTREKNLGVENA